MIAASYNVLLEECEAYNFHRDGFLIWASHDVVVRRCYANSRGYEDLPGCVEDSLDPEVPRCSATPEGGDAGFSLYHSSDTIIENCISEQKSLGFHIYGGTTFDGLPGGHDNSILASISNDDSFGVYVTTDTDVAANNLIADVVVVGSTGIGLQLQSAAFSTVRNTTIIGAQGGWGFLADEHSWALCGDDAVECSFVGQNLLLWNNAGTGMESLYQDDWAVQGTNSVQNAIDFAPAESIADAAGFIRNSMSVVPTGMGNDGCLVYVPEDSNMKDASATGDIGANIVYRTEDGVLGDTPLWDPNTGAFPCGAQVAGLNDVAGQSCFDVNQRLNVDTPGCPLPRRQQ
jgi:hypothetical protein